MAKIRLTEERLKKMIKESVRKVMNEEFYGYKGGEDGEMETYDDVRQGADDAISELLREQGFSDDEISEVLGQVSQHNGRLSVARDAIAAKLGNTPDAKKEATKIVLKWKQGVKDTNILPQIGGVWHKGKEYGTHFMNDRPEDVNESLVSGAASQNGQNQPNTLGIPNERVRGFIRLKRASGAFIDGVLYN